MGKVFRPSNRESSILDKIESSKEHARRIAINSVKDNIEQLANAITMKLIEERLVETINKNSMEEEIFSCLNRLWQSEDFDVDFQIAPLRNLVDRPNIVTLYITSFIVEILINHKVIIDIYGTDLDIYKCINQQVTMFL